MLGLHLGTRHTSQWRVSALLLRGRENSLPVTALCWLNCQGFHPLNSQCLFFQITRVFCHVLVSDEMTERRTGPGVSDSFPPRPSCPWGRWSRAAAVTPGNGPQLAFLTPDFRGPGALGESVRFLPSQPGALRAA